MPGTRKLGRPTAHRMAMLRGLVTYLLESGRLETTVTRAKEVQALADKMITLGKANTLASRRQALSFITKEGVVKKLFDEIAPKYAETNGGYTRVLKTGPRRGDGAEMALIEMVDAASLYAPLSKKEQREKDKADIKAAKEAEAKKKEDSKSEAKETEQTAEPAAEQEPTADEQSAEQ